MLTVCVPNNTHESELILHNMLHASLIGYTLVSLRALDKKGYTSHIVACTLILVAIYAVHATQPSYL